VERVREYGFDDRAILKATEIAAFMNQVNRIASGLGVLLEPGIEPWEFGTQR
jgi:alkylhydroperoxidase family enzyme